MKSLWKVSTKKLFLHNSQTINKIGGINGQARIRILISNQHNSHFSVSTSPEYFRDFWWCAFAMFHWHFSGTRAAHETHKQDRDNNYKTPEKTFDYAIVCLCINGKWRSESHRSALIRHIWYLILPYCIKTNVLNTML